MCVVDGIASADTLGASKDQRLAFAFGVGASLLCGVGATKSGFVDVRGLGAVLLVRPGGSRPSAGTFESHASPVFLSF